MFRKFIISLFVFIFVSFLTAATDNSLAKKKLNQAWKEYGYMEFSKAYNLFNEVIDTTSDSNLKSQAKTGLAFYYQFSKRGNVSGSDYEKAIKLYDECLKENPQSSQLSYWYALKAECYYRLYEMRKDDEYLKKAKSLWKLIDDKYPSTVAAQDSLLFSTVVSVRDFNSEIALKDANKLIDYINNKKNPRILQSVMTHYLANLFYWRKDYKDSFCYYEKYLDLGPSNIQFRNNTYFKLARLADLKLKDDKNAIKYYELLYKNAENDNKAYFSSQRAKEIKGKK